MPSPSTKTVYQDQQCKFDVPADSCRVDFGYKDRDAIIFDWREDHFYLCDRSNSRFLNRIIATDVSIEVMAEHWPDIIKFLQAKSAEKKGN